MATNIVNATTGIILILFGTDVDESIVVQRAPDVSGTPGTWTTVATINPIDLGGSPFIDVLPLDDTYRWYQAYGTDTGEADSNLTSAVKIKPVSIPTIDLGTKPWLNALNLELVMEVVSDTSGSIFVTASLNRDPANQGIPVVEVYSYSNLPSAPVLTGSYGWICEKPISGSGMVIFENTLTNRYSGHDSVVVEASDTGGNISEILNCIAYETNASATGSWVFVSGSDPNNNAVNISLVSSSNVGTITDKGAQGTYGHLWTVLRPASGIGNMLFQVTGSPGTIPDEDIAEIGQYGLVGLQSHAVVTSASAAQYNILYSVVDPYWIGGTVGATISSSFTALPGIGITAGSTTDAGGTQTQAFVVTRPDYGSGAGTALFQATKTGYVLTQDVQSIPEQLTNLAHLLTTATVTSTSNTQIVVSGSCSDPLSLVTPTISYGIVGTATVSGSNPYTIMRGNFGDPTSRITITGSAANRVPSYDAVDVPSLSKDSIPIMLQINKTSYTIGNPNVRLLELSVFIQDGVGGIDELFSLGGVLATPSVTVVDASDGVTNATGLTSSFTGALGQYILLTWNTSVSQSWAVTVEVAFSTFDFGGGTNPIPNTTNVFNTVVPAVAPPLGANLSFNVSTGKVDASGGGSTGATGVQGATGTAGSNGSNGSVGATGATGTGTTGATGVGGSTGGAGSTGATGPNYTVVISTTGPSGTGASSQLWAQV